MSVWLVLAWLCAVCAECRNDALLIDLLLSDRGWCDPNLTVLALLLRLILIFGGSLGLLAIFGLLGFILAGVDGGFECVIGVPVLEACAHHIGQVELLAFTAQCIIGNTGWKQSVLCLVNIYPKVLKLEILCSKECGNSKQRKIFCHIHFLRTFFSSLKCSYTKTICSIFEKYK